MPSRIKKHPATMPASHRVRNLLLATSAGGALASSIAWGLHARNSQRKLAELQKVTANRNQQTRNSNAKMQQKNNNYNSLYRLAEAKLQQQEELRISNAKQRALLHETEIEELTKELKTELREHKEKIQSLNACMRREKNSKANMNRLQTQLVQEQEAHKQAVEQLYDELRDTRGELVATERHLKKLFYAAQAAGLLKTV